MSAEDAHAAALGEGAFMGASVLLPAALGGRLFSMLGVKPTTQFGMRLVGAGEGAILNTTSGAAFNLGMASYLKAEGYGEEVTSRYQWDNITSLLTDSVIGAVFGGFHPGYAHINDKGQLQITDATDAEIARRRNNGRPPLAGPAPVPPGEPPLGGPDMQPEPMPAGQPVPSAEPSQEEIAAQASDYTQAAFDAKDALKYTVETAPGLPISPEGDTSHDRAMQIAIDYFAGDETARSI